MNFTFTVPVWGDWHLLQYLKHVLPSHAQAALEGEYVIHTTALGRRMIEGKPERALPACTVRYVEVNPQASYFQFSDYHQEAFDGAEACVFLQADAVVSATTFGAIRDAVAAGKKHINCAGINAVLGPDEVFPADGVLGRFAIERLIAPLRGNIWGTADVLMSPQTMYFRDGDAFWCHAFHHDPICIVNDGRKMDIRGSTLDWISPSYFTPAETCVLSGHDALVVEVSPPQKFDRHPKYMMLNATELALQVRDKVLPSHIHLFSHPVPIVGQPTGKYDELICDVLRLMYDADFYAAGQRKAA